MNKYLIIDSIARSGTTLLSSLINSQQNSVSLKGHISGSEFLLYADKPYIYQKKLKSEKNSMSYLKKIVKNIINIRSDLLKGLPKEFWLNLLNNVKSESDFVKEYYNPVLTLFNSKLIGLRYNQTIWYFDKWISKSENNYWLTIVRNPFDRSRSNIITHNWTEEQCLKLTNIYGKKIDSINNSKFILIYYEDLVENPSKIIKYIYDKLQIKLDFVEVNKLIGADGKEYRNQGSNVKLIKKDHRIGEKFNRIHKNSINISKSYNFSKNFRKKMKDIINKYNVFNRYI